MSADITQLIRRAERAGLTYQHGRKHARIVDPKSGRFVSVSSTPSCPHAFKNIQRDLRKYLGIEL